MQEMLQSDQQEPEWKRPGQMRQRILVSLLAL